MYSKKKKKEKKVCLDVEIVFVIVIGRRSGYQIG